MTVKKCYDTINLDVLCYVGKDRLMFETVGDVFAFLDSKKSTVCGKRLYLEDLLKVLKYRLPRTMVRGDVPERCLTMTQATVVINRAIEGTAPNRSQIEVQRGKLKATHVGENRYINIEDLNVWLADRGFSCIELAEFNESIEDWFNYHFGLN